MQYVDVVIENKGRFTDTFYTYKAAESVSKGQIVSVPFGVKNNEKEAYVFQTDVVAKCEEGMIKEISSVNEEISLTAEIIETCRWMKTRYGIKYFDAVRCFLPPVSLGKHRKNDEVIPLDTDADNPVETPLPLTEEQTLAKEKIGGAIKTGRQENFLLHGVTGSGKTEVYMQLISETINTGRNAIVLVPEIALTNQLIDRFQRRFGQEHIAILHSKLTKKQRLLQWKKIRFGSARIVIGARMAVFSPLENIGLIVMDEEHEATYKSDMTPKYETVDIALKRLMHYNGVLLMGSATPSVVSYQRAKEGIYTLVELKKRYNENPLPDIALVDMREELKSGNKTIFSGQLYEKIIETIEGGQQVILFLNRRGYSTFISCRECGYVFQCPECGISLTYHKRENAGICHYCGKKFRIPSKCPECNGAQIKYFGAGTEKVEEYTRELFADYTVDRLDLDSAKNNREIKTIIGNFAKGKTQILIGTQLVAKGLDFKNVGLVGVIAADVSLNIPDYRSTERTFQLVTQVAGRAGRGDRIGKVIVQSYTPDNFALTCAAEHDYNSFFQQEIKIRNYMDYPPFSDLIMVEFTSKDESCAIKCAENSLVYLKNVNIEKKPKLFPVKQSTSFKGKDSFRYYIVIKCPKGLRNKYIYYIDMYGKKLFDDKLKCHMTIDVNPYSWF